jgi:hypothetical protein
MELLDEALLKRFAEVGQQEMLDDPLIIAKFRHACGIGTWYAIEYDPKERMFFGYVEIFEGEWGYFSLDELESYQGRYGLGIRRDMSWREKRASQVVHLQVSE